MLPNRGCKPIYSNTERGSHLLRHTTAPCIICEPFFIDDDQVKSEDVVNAYIEGIKHAIKRFNKG